MYNCNFLLDFVHRWICLFFIPVIISSFQYLVTATCLITTIISYMKIFFFLRHNQINVHKHVTQGQLNQSLNMVRYRKAVNSALWVQVTLVICYLPFGIAVALTPQKEYGLSVYLARQFTSTLIFLNSSLNPLLYCWKIREVRQAVRETLRQLLCLQSFGIINVVYYVLSSVTEIARAKSPLLCANRSPIRYCFRAGAKAIRYSVNIALQR